MPKGKKIAGKKHAIATIKLPNQMPVCECTIVEEKKWNEDKKPYLHTTMQKNNRFKIYEMKKKLVKSLFNVCHCSCCWCCDNNIGHCKLLSCKNLQWTMVEKSKKISSQLMHDENIFFPCSFAVFILPIWINFGILKELFLQIIGAQRTIFNTRYFILLVSYILLIILFLSLVTYTYFEVKWYLKVRLTTLTIYFSNFVLQIFPYPLSMI